MKAYEKWMKTKKKAKKKLGLTKSRKFGMDKKKSGRYGLKPKKGQQLVVGIMIMAMAVIVFISLIPAIKAVINTSRGCSNLNCAGYIDTTSSAASCGGTNQTYVSTLEEDTLSCTILDLGIPYLIIGVLVAVVSAIIYGKTMGAPPQQDFGGYPQY